MRGHLVNCFETGYITMFPSTGQTRSFDKGFKTMVEIICHCRMPVDSGDTITTCNNGSCTIKKFHGSCVGIKDSSDTFTCIECFKTGPTAVDAAKDDHGTF